MLDKLNSIIIDKGCSLKEALNKLNNNRQQILVVVDNQQRLVGTITDGDIRRAIIDDQPLKSAIESTMNKNPRYLTEHEADKAYNLMLRHKVRAIPVVGKDKKLVKVLFLDDFLECEKRYLEKTNYIFIMAGGKGTRLDPFTKILPKPLIPVGEKPIIELIMGNFKKYGFNSFILSLNYKAEIIKLYFAENSDGYNISYTMEEDYLGTAGSLQLAKDRLKETFIVSNCDVIIEMNFDSLLRHHKKAGNFATIVGVEKNMQIPYGVIESKEGNLVRMTEKPEYNFVINSGVYVLEPEIINLIPKNEAVNMPDLLLEAKDLGYKVGVYPVNANWFDVGQWEEYQQTLAYLRRVEET